MIQVTNDTFGNASGNEVRFSNESDLKLHIHALAVDSGWYDEYRSDALRRAYETGTVSPVEGEDYMSLYQFEADLFKRAMRGAEIVD